MGATETTMNTPEDNILEAPMVLNKASLKAMGVELSNPTLCRMERRGLFPRRFYLSQKSPVWKASAVMAWLAEREAAAGAHNSITDQATQAKARRRGNHE